MTDPRFYAQLTETAMADGHIPADTADRILHDPQVDTLSLVHAAWPIRQHYWGRAVQVHILNNSQNGNCPEDCGYCTQAHTATEDIDTYPIKGDDEILEEARMAYEGGAHRYCMVFAGRGPNEKRVQHLARLVRQIKEKYPLQICVSAGLMDEDKTAILKEAGLDRLNHNLNTSRRHYPSICSTHTYDDRLHTLEAGRNSGLELCSGMIVGMGETGDEVIEIARTLRELNVSSIPVNFLIPFDGTPVKPARELTPEYCLRVLCLFRFINPRAELRVGAGRELHLRSMQVLSLYPANSLFLAGYLNARGDERRQTLQMIQDAGFEIESEMPLEELITEQPPTIPAERPVQVSIRKTLAELRPAL